MGTAHSTVKVNKVHQLGRMVIPKELRRKYNIQKGTLMETYVNDDGDLVLKKYYHSCIFCEKSEQSVVLKKINGCHICKKCIQALTGKPKREEDNEPLYNGNRRNNQGWRYPSEPSTGGHKGGLCDGGTAACT